MGHFPHALILKCISKAETNFRFEVFYRPFEYWSPDLSVGIVIVPIGFKTDFASVPWLFRRVIPAVGKYNEATVIHDYLCYLANKAGSREMRKQADKVFLEAMESLGVGFLKRKIMYFGVSTYTLFKKL